MTTTLQREHTRSGWGIAILQCTYWETGGTYYEVVRVNPEGYYLPICRTENLDEARSVANRHWESERG